MRRLMVFEGVVAILIILLLFTMCLMVSGGGSYGSGVNSTTMVSSIYPGKDGTFYAFAGENGNTIYALDSSGNLKWTAQVPNMWSVYNRFDNEANEFRSGDYKYNGTLALNSYGERELPVFSTDNGYLYLCVSENISFSSSHMSPNAFVDTVPEESLIAISPQGRILWNKNISRIQMPLIPLFTIGLYANNSSIYLFNDYFTGSQNDREPHYNNGLQVFNEDGSSRFILKNLSMMPAVDEDGYIYAVPQAADPGNQSIVKAYYPNGTLYWQRNIAMPIGYQSRFVEDTFHSMPLYSNHTLYVPVANGIWALNMDGSMKWVKSFNDGNSYLLDSMPVDDAGNVYFQRYPIGARPYVDIVTSDGNDIVRPMSGYNQITGDPVTGILYGASYSISNLTSGTLNLADLATVNLSAYDPVNDRYQWNHTFTPDAVGITISQDPLDDRISSGTDLMMSSTASEYRWNVKLLPWDSYNELKSRDPYYTTVDITPPKESNFEMGLKVLPGNGITFVNYYAAYYATPLSPSNSLNGSNCLYSNVLYALDKNGTVIWQHPLASYLTSMASTNGTIFYSTGDGKLNMATINSIAGGVTILALFYVFVRFFLAGFVVRAKDRLDKNENRNRIFKYIVDNPGSTLRDIARDAGVNLGTVRYHVFILKMNHRIISYMADDKHVRYFTNSRAYSKEEQFIISLMRRDAIKRILQLMYAKPGLTNIEISSVTGIVDSGISKYLKELCDKGIVSRKEATPGRYAYSLTDEASKTIEKLCWMMNGKGKAQASTVDNAE